MHPYGEFLEIQRAMGMLAGSACEHTDTVEFANKTDVRASIQMGSNASRCIQLRHVLHNRGVPLDEKGGPFMLRGKALRLKK